MERTKIYNIKSWIECCPFERRGPPIIHDPVPLHVTEEANDAGHDPICSENEDILRVETPILPVYKR